MIDLNNNKKVRPTVTMKVILLCCILIYVYIISMATVKGLCCCIHFID